MYYTGKSSSTLDERTIYETDSDLIEIRVERDPVSKAITNVAVVPTGKGVQETKCAHVLERLTFQTVFITICQCSLAEYHGQEKR